MDVPDQGDLQDDGDEDDEQDGEEDGLVVEDGDGLGRGADGEEPVELTHFGVAERVSKGVATSERRLLVGKRAGRVGSEDRKEKRQKLV